MIPALISLALVASVTHPRVAECPVGYFVHGTPPTGITECLEVSPLDVCNTRHGCESTWEARRLPLRVTCARGQQPQVITERRIACR